MIEIYLLEQLDAFARCGTLSAASEQLHISQPALTRSMKKLESDLGVTLFERKKNRLYLNQTGQLAARLAKDLLRLDQDFVFQVQAMDRSLRTIALGSCAPVPLYELVPVLQQFYADRTLSSSIQEDDVLLHGLMDDTFQLIVTHQKPEDPSLYAIVCGQETLSLSVPPAHPLAAFSSIHFEDLADVPILQYTKVGFWNDLVKKIPHPHLLLQEDQNTFNEIAQMSALPTFYSDYFDQLPNNRKIIAIDEPDVHVTYYLVCKQVNKQKYHRLFQHVRAMINPECDIASTSVRSKQNQNQ
jgi:DNA-binding transcriptional LysR family regulator